jgi:hypothetical protein
LQSTIKGIYLLSSSPQDNYKYRLGLEGEQMGDSKKFGETYRKVIQGAIPPEICEVCGCELEIDPETGVAHCPTCENPEV